MIARDLETRKAKAYLPLICTDNADQKKPAGTNLEDTMKVEIRSCPT